MPEEREGEKAQPDAEIHWEGDSLEVLRSFPDSARQNIGADLRRLQQGKQPLDYRPLTTAGAGVFELRDQDQSSWYRAVYLSRVQNVIHVLHCFEKKTRETPQKEIDLARQRLKAVRARLGAKRREEKHARTRRQ